MNKKYITILQDQQVWQYELMEWFKNSEDAEQFLDDKGHDINNCQWMETTGKIITFNLQAS